MSCPACGRDNRPGARFCADCGAPQAVRCDACAAELPPGARFCDSCGTPVAVGGGGTQTRKVVTVVFADLAGSTRIQETLDPESVRRMMDRFNDAMRTAVERHAGTVVKFTGDGLMAAFGVREVAEDDAWRSVQAAVAMQDAFTTLAWDADVALRVGVNTGEVIVTEGESDVVGDAVNVAARLESAAGPGGVLVGEETWRLTRHLARFEAVAPLTLKGKAEPVPAYQLIALGEGVVDATAPFVGRDAELARLIATFDEVEDEGTVRLATVIGSPGLGKTRLASEFASRLADRATVLEARFSATTAAATFAPVVDALRDAVGDDAVGDVASASPQEAFLAVRRAIEALAADRPVVLVLEDLHWAEPLVLDLVEHLVDWTQDTPVLLLALARPELREKRSALVETGGLASLVTVLEGLDPADSERLACDLLETDELPPALLSRILVGSEGNPLFVRELVRMLVDDGVLRRDGDRWRPTIEVDAITVPPTIQSLLAARVERLPADERTVLECAAVVGREFFRGAVAELLPTPMRPAIDVVLERLRQKEMVEPEGTYWIDEPVLRFHHVLLRDAAYRRLLKEVRAELHERYARWLENKAGDGDDNDEVLGYHLEHAHQYRMELGLFDDHTAVLGRRAADRLAAAGRRALDRDDLPAAAGLLGRALAVMDGDDPDRPGLLIDRCEALVTTGALADGSLAIAELEALAAGSPRLRAWASSFAAQLAILTDPGRLQDTVAIAEHAAAELTKLADAAGAAKAHAVQASALARLGRVAETEAALDRALAAAREAGDTRRATAVLAGAPLAALWGPSPVARASGRCLDVVRVLRITTSATTVEATSLRCQAVLEALRGRTDAARRMLASARRSLEELGHRHGLLSTDMFAGLVELLADDPIAAERALQQAHEGFLELGAGADAGQAAALLGRALLAQGRSAEAEELTIESERLGGADLKTAIAWRAVRAEALARRGSVDEALELARAAVALAEPTDALLDQADTHLAMATVLQLAGRADDAGASAGRAVELYERKGATVPAERAAALTRHAPNENARPAQAEARPGTTGPPALADNAAMHAVRQSTDATDGATFELVATRGQHLAVYRTAHELHLVETDAEGRLGLDVPFARDDLAGAINGLDERYVRSDPAVGQSWAAAVAYIESLNARAWDDFRAVYAPDFVAVDRRPAGFGTLDGEGMTEWAQGLVAMAPDNWLYAIEVPMISAEGHVALVVNRGTARGNPFEMVRVVVAILRGHHTTRIEFFEADELDDARARFVELTTGPPALATSRSTTVTRTLESMFAELRNENWAAAEALLAPDVQIEDRRPGLQLTAQGAAARENFRLIASVVDDLEYEVIATRGEHLVLGRMLLRGASPDAGFEAAALQLIECDERGRLILVMAFDDDDVEAATRVLDERFSTPLSAEPRETAATRAQQEIVDSIMAHDWDRLKGKIAPTIEFVDQRRALRNRIVGVDDYMSNLRQVVGLGVSGYERTVVATRGERVVLAEIVFFGSTPDGDRGEVAFLAIAEFDAEGRLRYSSNFEPDDSAAAIAHLDERFIAGLPAVQVAVVEVVEGFAAGVRAHDPAAVRTLYAPDARIIDHRPVGWGEVGPDRYAELLRSLLDLTPDFQVSITTVPRVWDGGAVITLQGAGTDADGGRVEIDTCQLFLVADGRIVRHEHFPIEAVDTVVALAEEPTASPQQPVTPSNEATRVTFRFNELFAARDWDALAVWVSDDFEIEDRRPGTRNVVRGRDAFVDNNRLMTGVSQRDMTVLATRGETLALLRSVWRGELSGQGPFEVETLDIADLDDQGQPASFVLFDPNDLDAAYAELDARFRARATPAAREALEVGDSLFAALEARNLDEFERLLAPELVVIDHRGIGFERRTRDEYLATTQALLDLAPDMRSRNISQPRATAEGAVALWHFSGTYGDGTQFERPFVILSLMRDGVVHHMETFATEDLDAAVNHFDELTAPGPSMTNQAFDVERRLDAAVAAHDWSAAAELLHPDFVIEDRRAALQSSGRGKEAFIASSKAMGDVSTISETPIATRGDLLSLARILMAGEEGEGGHFEVEFLVVFEIDDADVATRLVAFDDVDLDAAFEELDRRYEQGEGATDAGVWRTANALLAGYAARDWTAMADALAPTLESVDHQPTGWPWPSRGRDTYVAVMQEMSRQVLEDRMRRVAVLRSAPHGGVSLLVHTGIDLEGSTFERRMVTITLVDAGRITRLEYFHSDDLDAAITRFDELTTEVSAPAVPANTCVRLADRHYELLQSRDWDGIRALLDPDVSLEDRRRLFRYSLQGADQLMAGSMQLGGAREVWTPLATRGERLALFRGMFDQAAASAGTFEVEVIELAEVGVDGRLRSLVFFDPEDLDAAFAELDARFEAMLDPGPAAVHAIGRRAYGIWGQRDWDGLVRVFADDGVMVDRRPLGWGEIDPAGFVQRLQVLAEMVPDGSMHEVAVLGIDDRVSLARMAGRGTGPDGGSVEIDFHCLIVTDADRVTRLEFLAIDDPDGAVARFEELTAPIAAPPALIPRNAALASVDVYTRLLLARDVQALAAVFAEDCVLDDRRGATRSTFHGREAFAANERAMTGISDREVEPLATRGERLALVRSFWRGDVGSTGPFEVETLDLIELDENHLVRTAINFEPHDLDVAVAELDHRFRADEGAPFAPTLDTGYAFMAAHAARNAEALAATLHPELQVLDHRRTGFPPRGKQEYVEAIRGFQEQTAMERSQLLAVPRVAARGHVFLVSQTGTWEGAAFERFFAVVGLFEDGLAHRLEYFPGEELDRAVARFDELAGVRDPIANAASRLGQQIVDRILAHDPDGFAALHEPDAELEDRRPGFRHHIRGREGHVEQMRAMGLVREASVTVLATRGERNALFRAVWFGEDQHGGRFEVETLQVADLSPAGLLRRSALLDPADLQAAFELLDQYYAEGEAGAALHAWQVVQDVIRAHADNDPELFSAQARDVQTVIDHRRLGWGTLQGGQFQRAAGKILDRSAMRCLAAPRIAPNGIVAVLGTSGTAPFGGGPWEGDFIVVARIDGTTANHLEFFASEQLDRAIARFDELTS